MDALTAVIFFSGYTFFVIYPTTCRYTTINAEIKMIRAEQPAVELDGRAIVFIKAFLYLFTVPAVLYCSWWVGWSVYLNIYKAFYWRCGEKRKN